MSFKQEIKKVEKSVEKLIKKEIKDKGLVDTGTLLNSITASVKMNKGNMTISVDGEDYFKYLDDEYSITEDAFASAGFKEIEAGLENAYVALLEEARREGYMAAKSSFEAQLERKREEKMTKLMEKLDPLLDVLTDWMIDQMTKYMFGGKMKKPRFKVPVEVEEAGKTSKPKLPVEVEA